MSPSFDETFARVYEELRRVAHLRRLRHRAQSLCTTAIVNEVYIRLKDAGHVEPQDRLPFLAVAARAMRFVLVDSARRWTSEKRGGRADTVAILDEHDAAFAVPARVESTLALNEALDRLAALDEHLARVVEYRFFGGMTELEIAGALQVSARTVNGDWQRARIWLTHELRSAVAGEPSLVHTA
jgi:RNA polymerase sigma factor (TIGR02999 family)